MIVQEKPNLLLVDDRHENLLALEAILNDLDLNLETADFAWITRELLAIAERHAGGRLVSALEGGYDLDALAEASAAHVAELMRL